MNNGDVLVDALDKAVRDYSMRVDEYIAQRAEVNDMSECQQHGYYQTVNGCPECLPIRTVERIPIESVRRLDVKPNDVLVITLSEDMDAQGFHDAFEHLKSLLPDDIKIIVTTSNVDFAVLAGGRDD